MTMLFGILGCTHFPKKWQGEQRLARARVLMTKGDYQASLRENKEVLRLFLQTLGDQALFQMGLIYAHPENPNLDYQKSLECFQRLIKEFPQSDLGNKAKIWVLFLQEIIDKDKEIGRLNEKIGLLEKVLEEKEKRINTLQSQIRELQAQIENLKGQIEQLKEIDLGIEEKKRKSLPQSQ